MIKRLINLVKFKLGIPIKKTEVEKHMETLIKTAFKENRLIAEVSLIDNSDSSCLDYRIESSDFNMDIRFEYRRDSGLRIVPVIIGMTLRKHVPSFSLSVYLMSIDKAVRDNIDELWKGFDKRSFNQP